MIHLNLRPEDRIQVGDTVVRFVAKGVHHLPSGVVLRYCRFEVADRQHDLSFKRRLVLPGGQASFVVEKQSGRSARICLDAPLSVAVARIPPLPVGTAAVQGNNSLRCQAQTG